jgi:hypothetical protein
MSVEFGSSSQSERLMWLKTATETVLVKATGDISRTLALKPPYGRLRLNQRECSLG